MVAKYHDFGLQKIDKPSHISTFPSNMFMVFLAKIGEERERANALGKLFSSVPATDGLSPIPGNGSLHPRTVFVFINPTYRNVSARKGWNGARFPFVGTRAIWRVFHSAGLLDDLLMERIEKGWDEELSWEVLKWLSGRGLWMTNVVKTTYSHSSIPGSEVLGRGFEILRKEIEILKPDFIVSMGLVPFKLFLPREKVILRDVHEDVMEGRIRTWEYDSSTLLLSYFPVGRGDGKKAVEMLKIYNSEFGLLR